MNKLIKIFSSYFLTHLCICIWCKTFTICLYVACRYNMHTYHRNKLQLYLRKFAACCWAAGGGPKSSQSNFNFDSDCDCDCDSTPLLSACSLNYLIFDFGSSCRRLHMDSEAEVIIHRRVSEYLNNSCMTIHKSVWPCGQSNPTEMKR